MLFVNVPIGIATALAALAVLPGAARRPGRFDLPGAVTGTGGVAALVYGLSNAATSPDGASHWGDGKVVAALSAAAALLAAFAVIETRSQHALLPVRLLRQPGPPRRVPDDAGCGHGRVRRVLLHHPVRRRTYGVTRRSGRGVAFLPLTAAVLAASAAATPLVPRIGARPLLLTGSAA